MIHTISRPSLRPQKRASRTLSKAVSLHLEGKLESAARMLSKAIEGGEHEPGLYSALGHIHFEMRDYEAAATVYGQLVELEPLHRTGHFNLGVCQGHLRNWQAAAESFRNATEADGTRSTQLVVFVGIDRIIFHLTRFARLLGEHSG